MKMRRLIRTALVAALLVPALLSALVPAPALADVMVEVRGPGGRASQSLPDAGGTFDLNLPLTRNAVNRLTITATDAAGAAVSQAIAVTQVSLESVVVSQVRSERLSVEQVEALVARGDLDLANPENFNVSVFSVVLTIANRAVPISVPIVRPLVVPELGVETSAFRRVAATAAAVDRRSRTRRSSSSINWSPSPASRASRCPASSSSTAASRP